MQALSDHSRLSDRLLSNLVSLSYEHEYFRQLNIVVTIPKLRISISLLIA